MFRIISIIMFFICFVSILNKIVVLLFKEDAFGWWVCCGIGVLFLIISKLLKELDT